MDLKKVIKRHGMTVTQVAEKMKNNRGGVGISQPSMTSIINGNPTLDKLREIANILGCSLSELVADNPGEHSLTAFVEYDGKVQSAHSPQELKRIVAEIEKQSKEHEAANG